MNSESLVGSLSHYKTVRHFNIPGHAHFLTFSCLHRLSLLTNDVWRGWLAASIQKACDVHRIALWAYVFMPEHVHLLAKPRSEAYDMALFLRDVKKPVAEQVGHALREKPCGLLKDLTVWRGQRGPVFRFWQTGPGYDLNIWSMERAIEKAEYCHRNPIRRGLVRTPDQWRWSSFRWLEQGNRQDEPLRVNDWIE